MSKHPSVVLEISPAIPGIKVLATGSNPSPVVAMALIAEWNEREGKFDKYVDYLVGYPNGTVVPAKTVKGFRGVVFPG